MIRKPALMRKIKTMVTLNQEEKPALAAAGAAHAIEAQ